MVYDGYDDQRTVGAGSNDGWPSDSESAPTQFAGGSGPEDRPTPKTIPADDVRAGAWPPQPADDARAGAWPPQPADASPFRSTSEPAAGGKTMLMRTEPEPQIPLAWLVVVDGAGGKRGAICQLKTETIVGRAFGDLILGGDVTISSQHIKVRLEPKEEGVEEPDAFVVYDLASANGTYVGDKETYRDEQNRVYRRELKDGDHLLLGETTLVFKQIDK